MRKIVVLLICLLGFSCGKSEAEKNIKPIEVYQNKGYVVIEDPFVKEATPFNFAKLYLKNKDSIFTVYVPYFDGVNLKVGDTLKIGKK